MILCINQVLTSEELAQITTKLKDAEFVDGKLTAGWHAKEVKNNTQLKGTSVITQELRSIVHQAMQRNRLFQAAIHPKTIRPVIFSCYEPGMYYGYHVDNALMGKPPMRSDVSLTLFLSSPDTYNGGELVIETSLGEQTFKLAAGSAIAYPSSTLHRVEPVTTGIRLAAVTWIQSFIHDPNEREILFDLDTTKQVMFEKYGKTLEFDLICKTYANLLRKWVDI
ncbi:Fe2+-dependent dioxygenase [Gloeocapsopsis dulcis]|uniref:Fe2+-dependent dioxygenase n=1 Tax=Gloeocapsopsis dulcis AAB1 = 1H9 TaxID=1433147 RepID=A0A6N8G439_9CHRO|nr:Fe2+-dependent dioxygenase [Gloeocapsopsis dulcis]MUL38776.1 Fe2+-dependent dioxygenase [Gloeocapsopsis dulcis AAB1 = 1H9]WNN91798.1 Fe2+-dependent dioxygenase [Gloeocapsopsis dulcis]